MTATDVPGADPTTPPGPTAAAVAAALAEPGLDMRSARGVVETRARRRLRVRRGVLGGAAALVAVAAVGALLVRDDPGEVVADRDREPATTTTTEVAAPTTAAPVTVPVTSLVTTTTVRATTTVPPTTTTAPAPVNQPMELTVVPVATRVEAGRTVAVQVNWSDPDFADPAGPRITSVWGDPLVGFPIDAGGGAACETPGPGSAGSRLLEFRYSAPGTYTVTVEVSGCGGQGAFAESRTLSTEVTVLPPAGAAVAVAYMPPGGRAPDTARAFRYPGGTVPAPGAEQIAEARVPELGQVGLGERTGPATVLRFAEVADGDVVELRWDDGACAWGQVQDGEVVLDDRVGCYAPATGTGSTTVPPG